MINKTKEIIVLVDAKTIEICQELVIILSDKYLRLFFKSKDKIVSILTVLLAILITIWYHSLINLVIAYQFLFIWKTTTRLKNCLL